MKCIFGSKTSTHPLFVERYNEHFFLETGLQREVYLPPGIVVPNPPKQLTVSLQDTSRAQACTTSSSLILYISSHSTHRSDLFRSSGDKYSRGGAVWGQQSLYRLNVPCFQTNTHTQESSILCIELHIPSSLIHHHI